MSQVGYAFPNSLGAQQCASAVDSALGYPKPGIDVGGGIHAPPEQSVTQTYCAPIALGAQHWYPVDAVTLPILQPLPIVLGNVPAPIPIPTGPGLPDQPAVTVESLDAPAVVPAFVHGQPLSLGAKLAIAIATIAVGASVALGVSAVPSAPTAQPADAGTDVVLESAP